VVIEELKKEWITACGSGTFQMLKDGFQSGPFAMDEHKNPEYLNGEN
jgi:hypothetical protein